MTDKTDAELGKEIHDLLVSENVETPYNYKNYNFLHNSLNKEETVNEITYLFHEILSNYLCLDLTNDSLKDTPKRVAKMFVNETMCGLNYKNFPKIMTFENKMKSNTPVIIRDLQVSSLCGHHLQTIEGFANIAYIPNEKLVGLSKFSRIVDFFSRRVQEQERLTLQIFHTLKYILNTESVAVYIKAKHNCMSVRGVQEHKAMTTTMQLSGEFETNQTFKDLFFSQV